MRTKRMLAAVLGALLLIVAACGDDDTAEEPTTTTTADGATSTTDAPSTSTTSDPTTGSSSSSSTTSTTEAPDASPVAVYFGWTEKLGVVHRDVDAADLEAVLEALLDGPDDFETDIGMVSEIPAGTELLGVVVEDRTAVVDLDAVFESGGGSLSMTMRVAQVVHTLVGLDGIDSVTIWIDGAPAEDGIGGEGVEAEDLDETSFPDLVPPVLVSSPTPGVPVTSPMTVRGQTSEPGATVSLDITDAEGEIIADAEVTSGSDGTFAVDVTFSTSRTGLGAVIASVPDPAGGAAAVYEVPVRMG